MRSIAVIGGDSRLGTRVVAMLRDDPRVKRLVVFGAQVAPSPGCEVHAVDLAGADLRSYLADIDVVVDCATRVDPIPEPVLMERMTTTTTDNLMRACELVSRVVVASTTSVYGAWANAASPLAESATIRPNPGFASATHAAEIERRWLAWSMGHAPRESVILRIAPIVAPGSSDLLAVLQAGRPPVVPRGVAPVVQVVHVDDAARAVVAGIFEFPAGVVNIAADGAASRDEVTAMLPGRHQVRLPEELLARALDALWRTGVGDVPAAALAFLEQPPVVATDKARELGWIPAFTNMHAIAECMPEAAYVLPPEAKRIVVRTGIAAGVVLAGAALLVRRSRRHRRRSRR
ncbi:MAG: NAD-dependent epimerase/dehydratase family protein [Acidimicrobiia bacterium]